METIAVQTIKTMPYSADAEEMARLYWRCRRGMLENDLILQAFLHQYGTQLTQEEKKEFVALLDLPDQELCDLLMERMADDQHRYSHVLTKLRKTQLGQSRYSSKHSL